MHADNCGLRSARRLEQWALRRFFTGCCAAAVGVGTGRIRRRAVSLLAGLAVFASGLPVLAQDNTAPTLSSAWVDGKTLALNYDEALDEASVPTANAFMVEVDGLAASLSNTDPVAVYGRMLALTLTNAVTQGQTVTVSYTVPSANPLQDSAGNAVAALSDRTVTNHRVAGCAAPTLTDRRLFAVATVTVEGLTVGELTNHGYRGLGMNDYGSISGDSTFTLGSTVYTIDAVFVRSGGSEDGTFFFSLDKRLPALYHARVQIHVCDETFDLSLNSGAELPNYNYRFDNSGLDWASEPSITLRLSVSTEAVPPALVHNFNLAPDAQNNNGNPRGVRFSTGSDPAGYAFSSIGVITGDDDGTVYSATVCPATAEGFPPVAPGDIAGHPTCLPLTAPTAFPPGLLTFEAPADSKLAPNTDYTVVFLVPAGMVFYLYTEATSEVGADGWTLGDRYDFYRSSSSEWRASSFARAYLVAVRGASRGATDATLSALALGDGTLAPVFAPTVTSYTATVGNAVMRTAVSATPSLDASADFAGNAISGASIEYLDASEMPLADADPSTSGTFDVDLSVGDNVVKAKVTAADGSTTETYTLVVTRQAPPPGSDATLSALALSPGTLSPPFSPDRTRYAASIANAVSRVSVAATANDESATVAYLDASDMPLADADLSTPDTFDVDLSVGDNVVQVKVTGGNGTTMRTYRLTVARAHPNYAPVVANPIPDLTAEVGRSFSFPFPPQTFSDANGDVLTYTAMRADRTPLPAWLRHQGRSFSGTPQAADKETVSVTVTASDGRGGSVSDTFDIVVEDPFDVLVEFGTAASSNPIKVTEGGANSRLNLLLNAAAPRALTIPLEVTHLGSASTDDYELLPASVMIPQGATMAGFDIRAIPDGMREPGEGLRLDFGQLPQGVGKGTWGPYEIIEFVDDEAATVVNLSVRPQSVSEGMTEDLTVTAALSGEPLAEDTEVRLTVGAEGDTAVSGTDYRPVAAQTLTIEAGRTTGTAVFRLETIDNAMIDSTRIVTVAGSTAAAALRVEPESGVPIVLQDDDVPGIQLTPDALTVVEDQSETYAVVLQTRPAADVTVTITGSLGDLSVDKSSLDFTPANWSTPQPVKVSVADDNDRVKDADVTLTHLASGAADYVGLSENLVVSIVENDLALVFSQTAVSVPEGGRAEYTVALSNQPSATVTIEISGVSGDLDVDRTTLEFSTGNWDVPQTVILLADEDGDASSDPAVTLTHTASGGDYDGIVGEVQVTVMENDGGGGTGVGGGSGGGGGGGGAANRPPVVERVIPAQTLDVGETVVLDIRLSFYDRDQRALNYSVESADPSIASAETDDREQTLTIRGVGRGRTTLTVSAADRRNETASQTVHVTVLGPVLLGYVPRASDPMLEGFLRVVNRSGEDAEITIEATDDAGMTPDPVTLTVDAGETAHFNSTDLEDGNAAKGLAEGVGPGEGDWRLTLDAETDFDAYAYVRTMDGFLTAMHDRVPVADGAYRVAIFNPGSNVNQVSRLRLVNPGSEDATVKVTGVDDTGTSPGSEVTFDVPAGNAVTLTASELETGTSLDGALGDGQGKWRFAVTANQALVAMSLLSSPTGHLTNLSTLPTAPGADGVHVVPLFPSASDALGRQGFVRAVNRSDEAGTVAIAAFDDSEVAYDPLTLALDAGETVHFNSNDLELGNEEKGLTGSTGSGLGDWRLALSSDLDIDVLAYIRTTDGFLTSMHDVVPSVEDGHAVAVFNPGSNPNQVSLLRLVNPGREDATVSITGVDDAGASPGGAVVLTVLAGGSRTVDAATLESGGEGLNGALGDGTGKWRLVVSSDRPLIVMNLLASPTGHLTNLSTAPASDVPGAVAKPGAGVAARIPAVKRNHME